ADQLAPLEGEELPDVDELQAKLDALLKRSGELDGKRAAAEKAQRDAEFGRKKLAAIDSAPVDLGQMREALSERKLRWEASTILLSEAEYAVQQLQEQLARAKEKLAECRQNELQARGTVEATEKDIA